MSEALNLNGLAFRCAWVLCAGPLRFARLLSCRDV
ncbi:MAG: hypothetical protein ACI841_002176 [Planctomycetota bacterium]|jgi:hypothetical protein